MGRERQTRRARILRYYVPSISELFGPSQPIHESGRVDVEAFGEPKHACQAQIPLTALDLGNEGEMQADPIGHCHLTQPELRAACPDARAELRLRRVPLLGTSHQGQSRPSAVFETSGPGISVPNPRNGTFPTHGQNGPYERVPHPNP